MKYYYGMQSAHEAGVREHPQRDILRMAPDAHAFRPETLGDCWFFEAAEFAPLPSYVLPCDEHGIPAWGWHGRDAQTALVADSSWSDIVIKLDGSPLIPISECTELNYCSTCAGAVPVGAPWTCPACGRVYTE